MLAATSLLIESTSGQLIHGVPVREVVPVNSAVQWVSDVVLDLGPEGQWQSVTNSYVQLADGLNYWDDEADAWLPTHAELELVPGGALGLRAHQKAFFSPDLNDPEGTVRLWTRENEIPLRAAVLALSYRDAATGLDAILAVVQEADGEFFPPNQVIYRNAFDRLDADIVYHFRPTGVEQDVVLRQALPDPEDFGMLPETTRLRVITEVFEAPEVQRTPYLVAAVEDPQLRGLIAEPDWHADRLDFGAFQLAQSRAFPWLEEGESDDMLDMSTRLISDDEGRTALVEEVEYLPLVPILDELPQPIEAPRRQRAALPGTLDATRLLAAADQRQNHRGIADRLPLRPTRDQANAQATPASRTLLAATQAPRSRPGLVLDWRTESGSLSNYTFRGDETYFISNNVTCIGTLTTFEGGTVLKYATNTVLTVQTPVDWQGSLYQPVVLTGRDDPTVGQLITPTNALVGPFATKALVLVSTNSHSFKISHARIAHARLGMEVVGHTGHVFSHLQLVNCDKGISGSGTTYHLRNALFHQVKTNLLQTTSSTARMEQVTVNTAVRFNDNTTVFLTNAVLAGVTTLGSYTANSVSTFSSPSAVFQEMGAGRNYLHPDSVARNSGTTAINPILRHELRSLTTDPPVLLTSHFTANSVLHPTARRDTDIPDRGYHYAPMDYVLSNLTLTNAILSLTNGVAVGVYGPKGLVLQRQAQLRSTGGPGAPNRLVRFHSVQEVSTNWGSANPNAFAFLDVLCTSAPTPVVELSFTEVSHQAVTTNTTAPRILINGGSSYRPGAIRISHSHLRGVALYLNYAVSEPHSLSLTNNIFEASALQLTEIASYSTFTLNAYNNLFHRGRVVLNNTDATSAWLLKDNMFACDVLSLSGGYATTSHNGFRSGLTSFGSSNKTGLVPDYVQGPLGRFYYPTTGISTSLTNLVNTGSRNATNAGLFHFTVRPDQLKETNTVVDIGHHYVAGPQAGVRYVGTDTTTSGNWLGAHGLNGHLVINAATNLPANVTVTPSGHAAHTWASTTSDTRALWRPDASSRIAACWFSGTQFELALSVPHQPAHRLAFYVLDWNSDRADQITARNTATGQNLDVRGVDLFTSGKYMVYDVVGQVTFRFANIGAINAVLSGLFFAPGEFYAADNDSDGWADYVEDRNGNGVADGGESNWLQYSGDSPAVAEISVYTPIN